MRTTKPKVTEAQAQKAIMDLFGLYGWEVVKTEEDRFRGVQGLPDLLLTAPNGLQMWVEVKRPPSTRNPRGRVRAAQQRLLAEWRRRGVPCCVADGVTTGLGYIARVGRCKGYPFEVDLRAEVLAICDRAMVGYEWWPS
jgi:hypothetical protein